MPSLPTRTALFLVLPAALVVGTGCESRITGNEGNFQFSYPADGDILDFNKPIAVGASLELTVRGAGDRGEVALSDAVSSDPGVLEVTSVDGARFVVLGTGDGGARIEVKGAPDGGAEATDSVDLLARVPDIHHLRHTCAPDALDAAYVTGQTVNVRFDFEMENGQDVIGYGYYPVDTTGLATLDPANDSSRFLRLQLDGTGDEVLTSQLTGAELNLRLVTPGQLDGVAEPEGFVVDTVFVDQATSFVARPMVGELTVCQSSTAMTITSDTPDICTASTRAAEVGQNADLSNEGGWFELTGVATGDCSFTIRYDEAADGDGVAATFTRRVEAVAPE